MDYNGIEFIYLVALVCRILIYTFACAIYDVTWDKYISHNTKEYRQGLIKLYKDQQESETNFMYAVLKKAILALESGRNPTDIEDWVVKMEKEYRK